MAQSWNNMCEWVKDYGWSNIAQFAHPNDNVVSHSVEFNANAIKVTIIFRDCIPLPVGIGHYTCKYEVRKGMKKGVTFFRTIAVPVEGYKLSPSFVWWANNLIDSGTYENYRNSILPTLFEIDELYELTLYQKAAAALFSEFQDYYEDLKLSHD